MSWNEAKEHCVELGGKLFYDLDGTMTQLDSLFNRMGGRTIWVGVYADDNRYWRNLREEMVASHKLIWLEKIQ